MISVCIATYNGSPFILTQLRSILPQLGQDDEIIVSDDGSSDDTVPKVQSLNDERIHIVKGPGLGSPIPNFENALRHAKGDYIFLSDQDDKWIDGKVRISLKPLQAGTCDCVVTDCAVTDEALRVTHPSFYMHNHTRPNRYYNLLVKNGYIGGCMAFTRRVLNECLPFPADTPMHDLWIGNVAAFYFHVTFLPDVCSYFRRYGNNVSTSGFKSDKPLFIRLLYRYRTLRSLLRMRSGRVHK